MKLQENDIISTENDINTDKQSYYLIKITNKLVFENHIFYI